MTTTITITIHAFLELWDSRKNSVPAASLDTHRSGRKGYPQHQCCGKTHYIDPMGVDSEALKTYPNQSSKEVVFGKEELQANVNVSSGAHP